MVPLGLMGTIPHLRFSTGQTMKKADSVVVFAAAALGLAASAIAAPAPQATTMQSATDKGLYPVQNSDLSGGRHADLSGAGRLVLFHSSADNLVAGDTNQASDVFVRDRQTGLVERVSVGNGGIQG